MPTPKGLHIEEENEILKKLKDLSTLIVEKRIALTTARILAIDPSHEYSISKQIETLNRDLEMVEQDIKAIEAPTPASSSPALVHEYHRHTCDRQKQYDRFQMDFEKNQKSRKTHYYYIHGGLAQAHKGLFRRLAFDLEGALRDYFTPSLEVSCTALQVSFPFDASEYPEQYQHNILKNLFAAFGIAVNEQGSLPEKTAQDLLANSPRLKGLCYKDYVCIFHLITQWDWDAQITPQMIHWLIESFWEKKPVPEEAPTFLLFFGIPYEEGSEVEKEVQEAVKNSNFVRELPELNMVKLDDVKNWLSKRDYLASTQEVRDELLRQHLPAGSQFNMETVEEALLKIITRYNKQQTH